MWTKGWVMDSSCPEMTCHKKALFFFIFWLLCSLQFLWSKNSPDKTCNCAYPIQSHQSLHVQGAKMMLEELPPRPPQLSSCKTQNEIYVVLRLPLPASVNAVTECGNSCWAEGLPSQESAVLHHVVQRALQVWLGQGESWYKNVQGHSLILYRN